MSGAAAIGSSTGPQSSRTARLRCLSGSALALLLAAGCIGTGCIGTGGARELERELARADGGAPRAISNAGSGDAQLRNPGLPGPPDPSGHSSIRPIHSDAAREGVLLLHGWGSGPGDFGRLTGLLARRGLRVEAPLLPGHGTSPFELEALSNAQLLDAAAAHYAALEAECGSVHIVGFSMGSALAALLAAEVQPASLTLIAPFFRITERPWTILPIATWSGLLWPIVRFVPGRPSPTWRYDWLPVRSVPRLVALGRDACDPELLGRIRAPTLFVVSSGDTAASPRTTLEAFRALGCAEARLAAVHDSDHVLLHQADAAEVERLVLEFIQPEQP